MCFTEMASAEGIIRVRRKTFDLISFSENERPIGIQLFGDNPQSLSRAAEIVSRLQPDFIDINFGCPVKKIVKRGAGSALLRDLGNLYRIASAVVSATDIPVTAKIRAGWDQDIAVDISTTLQEAGVAALTLHPRTQKMQFKGSSDWEIISRVKQSVSIPVIGNGDIRTAEDAQRMLNTTGCDFVMIGRAARGNPWIFRQINNLLAGVKDSKPEPRARIDMLCRHLEKMALEFGERKSVIIMRKQIPMYLKGLRGASAIRTVLYKLQTIKEMQEKLRQYAAELDEYYVTNE